MNNQNENHDSKFETADVGAQRVARIYAEALLNAADKRQQADEVLVELEALVHDVFKADPTLAEFFASRAIGRDRKVQVIQSVFSSRASDVFTDFLQVLNEHDRLDLLRPILEAAGEIRDQRARRMRVLVETAVPLPDDQRERLRQELRNSFQREPVVETRVDPDLLGGLVVRVEDWLYDGSVRARLDNLRNQLITRSSHEIQSGRDRFSS